MIRIFKRNRKLINNKFLALVLVLTTISTWSLYLLSLSQSQVLASAPPPPPQLKYVALGDSITAGTEVTPSDTFVQKFTGYLGSDLHVTVSTTNLGTPFWNSSDLLNAVQTNQTFRTAITSAHTITLYIGVNDFQLARALYFNNPQLCGNNPDNQDCLRNNVTKFQNNFTAIFNEIHSINTNPNLDIRTVDIYYPGQILNQDKASGQFAIINPYLLQMNTYIHNYGTTNGVPYVNIHDLFNGSSGDVDPISGGYTVAPAGVHPTPSGHTIIANQLRALGYSKLDTDSDGYADLVDNCPGVANSDQANINSETILLPKPRYSPNDGTNIIGDNIGNACDPDMDHDGLTNSQEASIGTDPMNPDSDGDGVVDGAEFRCGSNPGAAASTAKNPSGDGHTYMVDSDADGLPDSCEIIYGTNPNNPDSDADGIRDGVEVLYIGSNPLSMDSDADSCADNVEVYDLDGNKTVNSNDLLLLATAFGTTRTNPNYVKDFDVNGDGAINSIDLALESQNFGKHC